MNSSFFGEDGTFPHRNIFSQLVRVHIASKLSSYSISYMNRMLLTLLPGAVGWSGKLRPIDQKYSTNSAWAVTSLPKDMFIWRKLAQEIGMAHLTTLIFILRLYGKRASLQPRCWYCFVCKTIMNIEKSALIAELESYMENSSPLERGSCFLNGHVSI